MLLRYELTENDYEFLPEGPIGFGYFAKVYLGKKSTGELVAIKRVFSITKEEIVGVSIIDSRSEQIILAELEQKRQLNPKKGRGFLAYYGWYHFYNFNEILYVDLVIEYANNGDLEDWIRKTQQPSEEEIISLMRDIAQALHFLHTYHILHCDLKPSNILLQSEENGRLHPKIADFGLARKINTTHPIDLICKFYSAPEIIRNSRLDYSSDIYSLSIIFFEIASHQTLINLRYSIVIEWCEQWNVFPFTSVIDSQGSEIFKNLVEDKRNEKLIKIPPKIAHLITLGFSTNCKDRPTAKQIKDELKTYHNENSSLTHYDYFLDKDKLITYPSDLWKLPDEKEIEKITEGKRLANFIPIEYELPEETFISNNPV